jgi:hypothetical protein
MTFKVPQPLSDLHFVMYSGFTSTQEESELQTKLSWQHSNQDKPGCDMDMKGWRAGNGRAHP